MRDDFYESLVISEAVITDGKIATTETIDMIGNVEMTDTTEIGIGMPLVESVLGHRIVEMVEGNMKRNATTMTGVLMIDVVPLLSDVRMIDGMKSDVRIVEKTETIVEMGTVIGTVAEMTGKLS